MVRCVGCKELCISSFCPAAATVSSIPGVGNLCMIYTALIKSSCSLRNILSEQEVLFLRTL